MGGCIYIVNSLGAWNEQMIDCCFSLVLLVGLGPLVTETQLIYRCIRLKCDFLVLSYTNRFQSLDMVGL